MNLDIVKERMRGEYYFDLRNIYIKDNKIREIFKYYAVGSN